CRLPAVRGAWPGRGRRAAGLSGSGLPALVLLALEIVPAAGARPADAGDAQREVVWVRALSQRFLVADQVLLEEAHQRLVERLHPVGGEALRDRLQDLLGAVLVLDHLADARVGDQHFDGGDAALAVGPGDQALRDHAPQ